MPGPIAATALSVERVMTRRVVLVLEDIPMSEVATISGRYDYNAFPIVSRDGRLVGAISKGGLLRATRESFHRTGVWDDAVSRWMAHGIVALRPTDSLEVAISLMVDHGLRSLPVIDSDARVVGVVSRQDLLRALEGARR
jgi:CBS domain-containing protein